MAALAGVVLFDLRAIQFFRLILTSGGTRLLLDIMENTIVRAFDHLVFTASTLAVTYVLKRWYAHRYDLV